MVSIDTQLQMTLVHIILTRYFAVTLSWICFDYSCSIICHPPEPSPPLRIHKRQTSKGFSNWNKVAELVEHYFDFNSSGLAGESIGEAHCLMYGLVRYIPQNI